MNRGNGIKLFNDLDSFAELLENSTKKAGAKQQKIVTVQIDNKRKIKFCIDETDRQIVL